MSVSHSVRFEMDCPFARCYEDVTYGKELSILVQSFDRQPVPKRGPTLIVLRRPFSHRELHRVIQNLGV